MVAAPDDIVTAILLIRFGSGVPGLNICLVEKVLYERQNWFVFSSDAQRQGATSVSEISSFVG